MKYRDEERGENGWIIIMSCVYKNNQVLVTKLVEHSVYSLKKILVQMCLNIFIESNSK